MGKTEITIFIVLANVLLLIFITGIIVFVFQYRKRKLLHEKEKAGIEKQYRLDLLNTQLQIQQETMEFIGREIHDSVGQKLTLASIYSQKLEFENELNPIALKLKQISGVINDSLSELRDLSKTLTDNRLQHTNLTELLRVECEKINDSGICQAVFVSDFTTEINVTNKSFLFRVVQEFIQNSLKHSGCSLISIELKQKSDGLSIRVSDDGKGFDIESTHSGGIGLDNMKRRMQMIGGSFNLRSESGSGTELDLFMPFKNLNAE